MILNIRFSLLICFVSCGFYSLGQSKFSEFFNSENLDHFELGVSTADDFGAQPYGANHVLFLSNRSLNGIKPVDPNINATFTKPYLLNLKSLKTTEFELPEFLSKQHFYIGVCALLPDSSGIIASHSRTKPYSDGRIGMTMTFIPFNGEKAYELPFIDAQFDYQHPYFDPIDYALYFASNIPGGNGGYDIYSVNLSFDGNWSSPKPMAYINTSDNEVFPSVDDKLNLIFSRSSKNYGMQCYYQLAGDSTVSEFTLNSRGDDFGLIFLEDSTAIISQSKRPGSVSNLHLFRTQPTPFIENAEIKSEVIVDSNTITSGENSLGVTVDLEKKSKSTEKYSLDTDSKKWTTDNSPTSGGTNEYSIIVGGFIERDLAENFLDSILGWAPQAFLSRHNGKFYVVHSVHKTREDANRIKSRVNNRDFRAWILSEGLKAL